MQSLTQPQHAHWILDGYNLIHAFKFIQASTSLEVAREKLICLAHDFQSTGDKRITLVFDAQGTNHSQDNFYKNSSIFKVIFSRKNLNADGTILMFIKAQSKTERRNITVITGDLLLREAILSLGCLVLSPHNFYNEVKAYRHNLKFFSTFKRSLKPSLDYNPFRELL